MKVAFLNVNHRFGQNVGKELAFYTNKCNIELGSLYLDANVSWHPSDRRIRLNLMHMLLQGQDWRMAIIDFDPDVVAVSYLTYYAKELNIVADWLKSKTKATVLVGGPHVTSVHAEILEDPNIDFAVSGEGEEAFQMFIDWKRGKPVDLTTIPGFIYREQGRVWANPRRAVTNLNDLNYPTLAQVDPREYGSYSSQINLKLTYMPIITTRGCPYKCVYCHDIMGKNVRYRSPQSVVDEVDYWRNECGIETFYINDDIFNINRKRLRIIFEKFCTRPGLRFAFPNGLRADLLDYDTIDLLVEGGTFYAMVAVESGDQRLQSVLKKRLNLQKAYDAIEKMGNTGIILGAFNILGFPTETEDEIKRTIEFNVSTTGLSKATFFLLNPHVGTEVYDMAISEGYIPETGRSVGYFNAGNTSPTQHVSVQRLGELQAEAYLRFYMTEQRLDKCLNEPPRNILPEDRQKYHKVDYSYVMRQYLELDNLDNIKDNTVRERLTRLLPNGILESY